MEGSRLRIDRHLVSYRVTGDPSGAPSRVAVNDLCGPGLADHLSAVLAGAGDVSGVWRIRRLDAHALVGAGWTAEQMARALGRQIGHALRQALFSPAEGVVWYPDRASYLGSFLVDCGAGRAFGRWQYAEFEHLAGLAVSRALTEAIADEPATALAALRPLPAADLKVVMRQLTAQDAGEALSLLGGSGSGPAEPVGLARAVPILRSLLAGADLPEDHRTAALALFVALARDDPEADPAGLHRTARDLAAAACAFARCGRGESDALRRALSADGPVPAEAWMGILRSPDLSGFVRWPAAGRQAVVDLLIDAAQGTVDRPAGTEWRTPLGGMFLLLPLLAELPWREATDGWPALDGSPAARVVAFLTVTGALGRERNPAAIRDPVVRMAMGIPDEVGVDDIAAWARAVPAPGVERLVGLWVEQHRRAGRLAVQGAVALDPERDLWVGYGDEGTAAVVIDADVAPDRSSVARDIEYASLALPVPRSLRRALAVLSQSLLRLLAWRLPGFSRSSLTHLWDNFLDFDAVVWQEEERIIVECGKPPLDVVLSLTGMKRKRFHLETTGPVEWVLTNRR